MSRCLPITSVHQSMLGMFFKCPTQFKYRYSKNIKRAPGIVAIRGTTVHKVNEVNLKQKIVTKRDLPLSDLKDAARDRFIYGIKEGVRLKKSELSQKTKLFNNVLNDTLRLTSLYHKEVAPSIDPLAVEEYFSVDIGFEIPISGTIDIRQKNKINDLKAIGMKWAEDNIKRELQVVLYCLAYEKTYKTRPLFEYDLLRVLKTKTDYTIQTHTPTSKDYNKLARRIAIFLKMLKRGDYPPSAHGTWWCSEDWCGYYDMCKYV